MDGGHSLPAFGVHTLIFNRNRCAQTRVGVRFSFTARQVFRVEQNTCPAGEVGMRGRSSFAVELRMRNAQRQALAEATVALPGRNRTHIFWHTGLAAPFGSSLQASGK